MKKEALSVLGKVSFCFYAFSGSCKNHFDDSVR